MAGPPAREPARLGPSGLEDRPTILAIGRGEAMLDAIALALDRHGVAFETGDSENAVQSVFVHAPDLVLLVGDAALEEGRATLEKLAGTVATAVIPVAILADDAGLDHRMQAARLGAVAVVPRSASADAMAMRIAEVARELPERKSEGRADLGEASLDEVVELFARRLRSGILAVSASGGSERVVLRGDRPVTQAIEELVDRLRPLVTQSETVKWEFQQAATGQLAELKLDDETSGEVDLARLFRDRRLVIVEKSPARADDLVVALRERGAHVVVIDGEGTGLAKARAIDPDVILVDVSGVGGWAGQAMQLIRGDNRLRWAALLVTRGEELWKGGGPEPDVTRLAAGMLPLVEPDESLTSRVRDAKAPIDVRLETTGPTRFLRALARAGTTCHVTVRHRRATIEIDLAEGLVVGVRGEIAAEGGGATSKVEGAAALAAWLSLSAGRVRIEKRDAPSVANVMSPVDDAIAAADRETSPIVPSIPPPAGPPSLVPSSRPTPAGGSARPPQSGETDARVLVSQLESLLDRLRHTLPPGALEVPSETAAALAAVARKDATPIANPASATPAATPAAIPAPAKLPGPGLKPQPRRATQMGMPVPPIAPRVPPPTKKPDDPPAAAAAPVPAPPAPVPVPAPPPPPPPTEDEPPTTKRAALATDPMPPTPPLAGVTDVGALLANEVGIPSIPSPIVIEPPTQPGLVTPAAAPLEVTDQIAMPPAREEADDLDAAGLAPRRSGRGMGIALVAVAALVALIGIGTAAAWRMGLFTGGSATPVVTPLPPTTIAAPFTAVPTTTAIAPPTSVVPPTTVVEIAPPPTTAADIVPPPTSAAEVVPPTSVAEVEPPPTTTVEVPPPETSVAEVAPPPSSTEDEPADETEGSDDGGDAHASGTPHLDDVEWLIDRANFRRSHGDLPGAEADYLRILRLSSNNARAMAGLARLHLARHDARTAATWARRLADGHMPNAGNFVLLGDALQASGDAAGARHAWERALEISPGYRDARRRLGR